MTRILTIAGALAAATLLGGWTWGFDRQGPYCLYDPEYTNCGYPSFEACWATARGAPSEHPSNRARIHVGHEQLMLARR